MIKDFAAALRGTDLDLDWRELADVLWLATRAPLTEDEAIDETDPGPVAAPSDDAEAPPAPSPPSPALDEVESPPQAPAPAPASEWHLTGGAEHASALALDPPPRYALPARRELARALRPLKRRHRSARRRVIGLEATVTYSAETGLLIPVTTPAMERWFTAVVVTDASPSMAVWQDTSAAFAGLLEHHGAFARVVRRTLYDHGGVPALSSPAGVPCLVGEPALRAGRTLIFLVSDCLGPLWSGAGCWTMLRQWGQRATVVLVQVLPESSWGQTPMGEADIEVTSHRAGVPNKYLDVTPPPGWAGRAAAPAVVPVAGFDEVTLGAWSSAVMVNPATYVPAVVVEPAEALPAPPPEHPAPHASWDRTPIPSDRLADTVRGSVSADAYRLAVLLSAIEVTLPVARIVMEELLPNARQTQLAELLAAGILHPSASSGGSGGASEAQEVLAFAPQVREILHRSLTVTDTLRVWRSIAPHLELTGRSSQFALVRDLMGATPAGPRLDDDTREADQAAVIAAQVAARLGLSTWFSATTPWQPPDGTMPGLDDATVVTLTLSDPASLSPRSPDTVDTYLNWVIDRCQRVDLTGAVPYPQLALRLDDVLVPLRAGALDGLTGSQLWHVAVAAHPRTVVLADAGGGKTTLLRSLALTHARARRDPEFHDSPGASDDHSRLPVLVDLGDYGRNETWRTTSLTDFLAPQQDRKGCPSTGLSDLFAQHLAAGRLLLLLDGLDQVTGDADLSGVLDRVMEFTHHHVGTGNRLVVTSRAAGYRYPLPKDFAHLRLHDLDRSQVGTFVHRWCAAVEAPRSPGDPLRQRRGNTTAVADQFLTAIDSSPGLARLATNPLLLRILVLLHTSGVRLPQQRAEIYHLAADALARSWRTAQNVRPSAPVDLGQIAGVLSDLAGWIHTNRPDGTVTRAEVILVLGRYWARTTDRDWDPASPAPEIEASVEAFLAWVQVHTGLFVEQGPGTYGFAHLTFQEYYAARHLIASPAHRSELIRCHVPEPHWREPILLALALVGRETPEEADELLRTAVLGSPEAPASEAAGVALPGERLLLALDCLTDQISVSRSLAREVVTRAARELLDHRSGAGRTAHHQAAVADALRALHGTIHRDILTEVFLEMAQDMSASQALGWIELVTATESVPLVVTRLLRLGGECTAAGHTAGAVMVQKRVVIALENSALGSDHPHTRAAREDLARLWELARLEEQEELGSGRGRVSRSRSATRLPDPARSAMVLIGCSRYQGLPALPAAANVVDLARLLTDPAVGGFDPSTCEVIVDPDDTRQVLRPLQQVARTTEDTLLVYYAGHGFLDEQERLHLAVQGTDPELLSVTAVAFDAVNAALNSSPARQRVVILDCCHAGAAVQRTVLVNAQGAGAGSTYILAATGRHDRAYLTSPEHSAFTAELLDLLRNGVPGELGPLDLDDLHAHLRQRLAAQGLPLPSRVASSPASGIALTHPAVAGRPHAALRYPLGPRLAVTLTPDGQSWRVNVEMHPTPDDSAAGEPPQFGAEELVRLLRSGETLPPVGLTLARYLPVPDVLGERLIGDSGRRQVAGERVLVTWARSVGDIPSPVLTLLEQLRAVNFLGVPDTLGLLIWTSPGGHELPVAVVTRYLPRARTGRQALIALLENGVEREPAETLSLSGRMGRIAAALHVALATRTSVLPEPTRPAAPADVLAWHERVRATVDQAAVAAAEASGTRVAQDFLARLPEWLASVDALADAAAEPPLLQQVHHDLHVGRILRWAGGLVITGIGEEPDNATQFDVQPAARDLARLLQSLDDVARDLDERNGDHRCSTEWLPSARRRMLRAYSTELSVAERPDLLDPRLIGAFEAEYAAREVMERIGSPHQQPSSVLKQERSSGVFEARP